MAVKTANFWTMCQEGGEYGAVPHRKFRKFGSYSGVGVTSFPFYPLAHHSTSQMATDVRALLQSLPRIRPGGYMSRAIFGEIRHQLVSPPLYPPGGPKTMYIYLHIYIYINI